MRATRRRCTIRREAQLDERNVSICIVCHGLFAEHANGFVLIGDHEEPEHFKGSGLVASDGREVRSAGACIEKSQFFFVRIVQRFVAHLLDP